MWIQVQKGIPVSEQRLYGRGDKELEDAFTLGHYGVQGGDTIRLVPLVQSGSKEIDDGG